MTDGDKERIRTAILDTLVQTRLKIEELEEAAKPVAPDKALGRLTRMEALQDRSVAEAALERTRADLNHLEAALRNIVLPTFGKCIVCGDEIGLERMEVLPQSTHCVNCAPKVE